MVEICEVEHLEVEATRPGFDEGADLVEDFCRSPNEAVLSKLGDVAVDCIGSSRDLGISATARLAQTIAASGRPRCRAVSVKSAHADPSSGVLAST